MKIVYVGNSSKLIELTTKSTEQIIVLDFNMYLFFENSFPCELFKI